MQDFHVFEEVIFWIWQRFLDAAKNMSGDRVPLVTMFSCEIECTDMYLKHQINESSEYEDGT